MSKVIIISRTFPATHPRRYEPTFFVEKIWKALQTHGYKEPWNFFNELPGLSSVINIHDYAASKEKYHTIRAGRRWKLGDMASLRVWSGLPYRSKQIAIVPDLMIQKAIDIEIHFNPFQVVIPTPGKTNQWGMLSNGLVAENDGLSYDDFQNWFDPWKTNRKTLISSKPIREKFIGQILCFTNTISY